MIFTLNTSILLWHLSIRYQVQTVENVTADEASVAFTYSARKVCAFNLIQLHSMQLCIWLRRIWYCIQLRCIQYNVQLYCIKYTIQIHCIQPQRKVPIHRSHLATSHSTTPCAIISIERPSCLVHTHTPASYSSYSARKVCHTSLGLLNERSHLLPGHKL